jgi:PTS system sorbose-specific IIA component
MNVDELCEHLTTIANNLRVVWKHLETAEEDF